MRAAELDQDLFCREHAAVRDILLGGEQGFVQTSSIFLIEIIPAVHGHEGDFSALREIRRNVED